MAAFTGDKPKSLLGMGNPLLDISANVPMAVIEKYEVKLNDAILAEEKHMPMYKEMVDNYEVQYIAGGATQNSIRVAQWMTQSGPGSTAFMGAVGDDEYGQTLGKCAGEDGVDTHYMIDADTPTGTCAVLVHGGERSLIANLAAANKFQSSHLSTDKAAQLIDKADIYYVAGFFLTVSVDSIIHIGKQAAANLKTFCMNLSAPFLIEFFSEQMAACLPYTDFVFANEVEAETYGEKQGWGKDLEQVALKLAAMPKVSGTHPRTVVFTQGSKSTIVAQGGVVTSYAVEPLAKEALVDTNGAGDAFVGGFLSGLMRGKNIAACVDAGHWAARVIIQQSGCTFPKVCEYKN